MTVKRSLSVFLSALALMWLISVLLTIPWKVLAQNPGPVYVTFTNPNGNACGSQVLWIYGPSGALYTCQNGTVAQSSGGGGGPAVQVNGSATGLGTTANFNGTTPAAPGGDTNCTFQVSGTSISCYVAASAANNRILISGVVASCTGSVPVTVLPPSNGPVPLCEADNLTAYDQFAYNSGSGNVFYQRVDLPQDWAGTLKLNVSGWSSATNAVAVNVQTGCVGTTSVTTGITFNTANALTFTPNASSFRSVLAAQALTTTGCSAGNELQVEYTIIPANGQTVNIRTLQVTE